MINGVFIYPLSMTPSLLFYNHHLPQDDLSNPEMVKAGYREVGVLQNQGIWDGTYVDVMAMEKML